MDLSYHRIDIGKCADAGHMPRDIVPRKPKEQWYVCDQPVDLDKPVSWSMCRAEDHVAIPLIPYRIMPSPEMAFAFVFGQGVRAAAEAPAPVRHLHVAVGVPVSDGSDDPEKRGRPQLWLGFAVRVVKGEQF